MILFSINLTDMDFIAKADLNCGWMCIDLEVFFVSLMLRCKRDENGFSVQTASSSAQLSESRLSVRTWTFVCIHVRTENANVLMWLSIGADVILENRCK